MRILAFILLMVSFCYFTNGQTTDELIPVKRYYDLGRTHIFKLAPSFTSGTVKGGVFSYEISSGSHRITVNSSIRYFPGLDSAESLQPIPKHIRIELQPRFWYKRAFSFAFVAPVVVWLNNGSFAGGGVVGMQSSRKNLTFESFIGIQSITNLDPNTDKFVKTGLKFGLNLGYKLSLADSRK
ncbi:MAG: hypothetical protein IH946_08730 [Bacteroidetes bacterium]|nr:hypothetical protein [Bacteroidota bacterium]